MGQGKYQIDMCRGPLFGKIILFAIPLILTGLLQLTFNAMDLVVLGHYAPHEAMAAVGATLNFHNLVINVFVGLSIAANILVARHYGAKDRVGITKAVHTSIVMGIYGGLGMMVIGQLITRPVLVFMGTPSDVLEKAILYVRICFLAIPMICLYNTGCAILRAVGDTRRPFYFLIIAGLVNIGLNLFFVIVCKMDVAGVAIATAVSHAISAALILWTLCRTDECCKISRSKLHISWPVFREILKLGLPAAFQSSCFSISNMTIQSSINSFGSIAMAGTAAAISLEGMTYVASFAFHQCALSFVSQNYGGEKYHRISRSIWLCLLCGGIACEALGLFFWFFGVQILGFYNPSPEVIEWGMIRMRINFTTYCLCGMMDVVSGGLRGLGYSLWSAIMSLLGACVYRILWVVFIFPLNPTMSWLVWSYPISWILVFTLNGTILFMVCRSIFRNRVQRFFGHCTAKPLPHPVNSR